MNPLELLQNYTYTQALLGTVLIGGCAGALGPLVYVRRTSLLADAISHSSLPGLLTAFLVATAMAGTGEMSGFFLAAPCSPEPSRWGAFTSSRG